MVYAGQIANELLDEIKAMPDGKHISFAHAKDMYFSELSILIMDEIGFDDEPLMLGHSWVEWISSKGYKINLTGDEYEVLHTDKTQ